MPESAKSIGPSSISCRNVSAVVGLPDFDDRENSIALLDRNTDVRSLIDDDPVGIVDLAATDTGCVLTTREEHFSVLNQVLSGLQVLHTTGGIKTGAAATSGAMATVGTTDGCGASAAGGTVVVGVVAAAVVVELMADAALVADSSSPDPHAAIRPATTNPATATLTNRTTRPRKKGLALGRDSTNLTILYTFVMSARGRSGNNFR